MAPRSDADADDNPFAGSEIDRATSRPTSSHLPMSSTQGGGFRARFGLTGVGRRTLGIALLLLTVFLWTLSNFMTSVSIALQPLFILW